MKVVILFNVLGDYMPKQQYKGQKPYDSLVKEIKETALKLWREKQPDKDVVRFMQKMPAENGLHFRFLNVTQKDENTLLVSYHKLS